MSCSPRHAPDPLWHCQPAQVRPSFPACHPHRGTLPLPCLLATPTGRLRRERARGRDAAPPPHARRARSHRDLFLGDVHRDALTLPCGALILSSILSHSQSPLTQLAMHVCFRGGPPKFQNSFCSTPSSLIDGDCGGVGGTTAAGGARGSCVGGEDMGAALLAPAPTTRAVSAQRWVRMAPRVVFLPHALRRLLTTVGSHRPQGGCAGAQGDARPDGAAGCGGVQHLHVPVLLQRHLHRPAQQRGVEWDLSGARTPAAAAPCMWIALCALVVTGSGVLFLHQVAVF